MREGGGLNPPTVDDENGIREDEEHLEDSDDAGPSAMEKPMYNSKTYVTDGFSHGCYWKSSGKFEIYADNLIHQQQANFETKMNHQHFTTSSSSKGATGSNFTSSTGSHNPGHHQYTNSSSSGAPYSDSGGIGGSYYTSSATGSRSSGGGYSGYNQSSGYATTTTAAKDDGGLYGGGSGYNNTNSSSSTYYPQASRGNATSGSDGAIRSGRKLPNVGHEGAITVGSGSARNGKRQLPNVQGRSSSSLDHSSDYRLATQSPTGRKLPVPQRGMKTGAGMAGTLPGQPPLIDNFNIDLSLKTRKSISGPIDEDSLNRLKHNMFGNFGVGGQNNKENNFMTTSSFYMNNGGVPGVGGGMNDMMMDDMDDEYCYSDFTVTSQITLSSRKIKKLPKIGGMARQGAGSQPKNSQSMSYIPSDGGYNKGWNDNSYNNPLYNESDYYEDDVYNGGSGVPAIGYNDGYSSYNDHDGYGGGEEVVPKAKKMLPTVQHNSSSKKTSGQNHELGYPYNKVTYPTTTSSSSSTGVVNSYRDEYGSSGHYNGHQESSYDNHAGVVVEKRHEAVTKGSLMNDRVSALKNRSRSTTPVSTSGSSGSGSGKQLPNTANMTSNSSYINNYQSTGYNDTMTSSASANSYSGGQQTTSSSSSYYSTAANSQYSQNNIHTTTPKLLPKPVQSSNNSSNSTNTSTTKNTNFLASPEKKPPLRRSPEMSDPYDNHLDPYDMGGSQQYGSGPVQAQVTSTSSSSTMANSRNHELDPYVNDRRGSSYGDVHRNDPYNDPYDVHQDDPDAYAVAATLNDDDILLDEPSLMPATKKPGKDGQPKKQLHFFDEREECIDEELEQLEQSAAEKLAKQQQQNQSQQQQQSQQDQMTMMNGHLPPVDKLDASKAAATIVSGMEAVAADIGKDISQLTQGKRENFNARDKWLWAYDQIINWMWINTKPPINGRIHFGSSKESSSQQQLKT
ncbi:putative uncharacterized protein DDB_G0289263 [Uranotaenia lowii]|uniref:putative uncharacterized protein DDB_G0289263 n=1 Tax=Uranotaenia lowii TaxID=190385 RepID=UPI00247A6CE5|nr:putative uncharacterized protein DDB_G0289263 [Uranotaenia lowii]